MKTDDGIGVGKIYVRLQEDGLESDGLRSSDPLYSLILDTPSGDVRIFPVLPETLREMAVAMESFAGLIERQRQAVVKTS